MATQKNSPKLITAGRFTFSWKGLFIATSLAVNAGFIVMFSTYLSSNALDGLFMQDNLARYCSTKNDDKFSSSKPQVKALREYVCDRSDAHQYFTEGLIKYYQSKGLGTSVTE